MVVLSTEHAPLIAAAAPAPPAATAMACEEVRPADLDFVVHADAVELDVGDVVELDAEMVNTTAGLAAIPLFRLAGAEPSLVIEDQDSSYPQVDFVRYWLRAVRPGRAELQVSVNFETSAGCRAAPLFLFRSARSPRYPITVRGGAARSATPTPTPTPLAVRPPGRAARAAREPGAAADCSVRPSARLALLARIDSSLGRPPRSGVQPLSVDGLVAAVWRITTCRAITPARTSATSPPR